MSSSLAGLSAAVTRILYLTGFSKELKTKDIQAAFADWENVSGGFKIKWKDDTSLLIVFQDASVAKRAYLQTLAYPPGILGENTSIKPYDGPDAQVVIQNVNSRGQHNPNNPSRSHNNRSNSISIFPGTRAPSGSVSSSRLNGQTPVTIPEYNASGREPSPTLPNLPTHPTLNSLINSSLGEVAANATNTVALADPAVLATSLNSDVSSLSGGPRIGDPGKRMLGAALGVRHPSLAPRTVNGNGGGSPGTSPGPVGGADQAMREVQRAMGGLMVAE